MNSNVNQAVFERAISAFENYEQGREEEMQRQKREAEAKLKRQREDFAQHVGEMFEAIGLDGIAVSPEDVTGDHPTNFAWRAAPRLKVEIGELRGTGKCLHALVPAHHTIWLTDAADFGRALLAAQREHERIEAQEASIAEKEKEQEQRALERAEREAKRKELEAQEPQPPVFNLIKAGANEHAGLVCSVGSFYLTIQVFNEQGSMYVNANENEVGELDRALEYARRAQPHEVEFRQGWIGLLISAADSNDGRELTWMHRGYEGTTSHVLTAHYSAENIRELRHVVEQALVYYAARASWVKRMQDAGFEDELPF